MTLLKWVWGSDELQNSWVTLVARTCAHETARFDHQRQLNLRVEGYLGSPLAKNLFILWVSSTLPSVTLRIPWL